MDADTFANLARENSWFRELRYNNAAKKGYRTLVITLVTTLLDSRRLPLSPSWPNSILSRWQIELNLRHNEDHHGAWMFSAAKPFNGVLKGNVHVRLGL